ncbi:MAG TPA: type VI secretion system ImpA family N-terminal domain-containing protein [Xanthobacteraceae bacterium]|nr:type VI secretion system ImpA family N-terminal domain-containing protein [Xanthobacteraceae bacterium]
MAGTDLAALTAPVSEDDPCGPDLDLEGDADYLNFLARAEGLLPSSFFSGPDGAPFDRASVDFATEFANAAPLLERTRDIRLLSMLARFHLLNRDIVGFRTFVEAIARLLDERWDAVHPRGEGGDYMFRMSAIETLDDPPTVILPMQFIPLALHRRHGQINFRAYMVAVGEARAPEGEEALDGPAIERALMEVDLPPLVEMLQHFDAVQRALGQIRQVWIERAGFEQAVNLERAVQLSGRIVTLLNDIVVKRDPSAGVATAPAATVAQEEQEAEASQHAESSVASVATGPLRNRDDVAAAFAAVVGYFSRAEPSSPALLLARQAQQLVGCSFIEAMRILMPAHVEQASIAIGGAQVFDIPIERLSMLPTDPGGADGSGHSAVPEAAGGAGEGSAAAEASAAPAAFKVESRQQALALLDQIAAYYRAAEPTSPIPIITDRARRLAERDFMTLLKDFLPEAALRTITQGG